MKTRTLNGAWTLEIPGTPFAAVPATVPGSVYHDLLAAERIPDPFYRDNEMEALKLMDNDFVYFRSFQVDDALLAGDKVLLRAEGLDTIAAVVKHGYDAKCVGQIERTKFYEKAAKAYVTICTSERLPYGCIILQKGVM